MAHEPKSLQFLVEAAAPAGKIFTFKSMFGAILVLTEGKACAALAKTGIGLKLDEISKEELLEFDGAEPFRYAPNCPAGKDYLKIPDSMLESSALLSQWLARSADYVQTLPAKPKRRRISSK